MEIGLGEYAKELDVYSPGLGCSKVRLKETGATRANQGYWKA